MTSVSSGEKRREEKRRIEYNTRIQYNTIQSNVIDQQVLFPELEADFQAKEVSEMRPIWETQRQRSRDYQRDRILKQRLKVLARLGNKCVRCGFSDIRALQIDHIEGGGSEEIRKYTSQIYKRYLERNCEGLQLLCANCNWIKKFENNELPYAKRK